MEFFFIRELVYYTKYLYPGTSTTLKTSHMHIVANW